LDRYPNRASASANTRPCDGNAGLPPERIGEAVHTALTAARPKVRYTLTPQPLQFLLSQVLPKRTLDRIVGKRLGLLPG
jgi:hypothetical protein